MVSKQRDVLRSSARDNQLILFKSFCFGRSFFLFGITYRKPGADFKDQLTYQSDQDFFNGLGYRKCKFVLISGTCPVRQPLSGVRK